ncbi:MAG: fumarate hydratase [candidate division Zixibacteria bacterium]|jgi:fumarate hydratase subunit alpha|nr:fumarate hydratase [candidate division Zixibacteria bacterium]
MREIDSKDITAAVRKLSMDANYYLGEDVLAALKKFEKLEESPLGKEILNQIIKNADIAASKQMPLCQDTGLTVLFVEIGQDVHVKGDFNEAIQEGVRQGYRDGYLRKSIVVDPLNRKNTGDNTPAVISTVIVPGDKIKLTILPKGGGSENMSRIKMLKPADGEQGVKEFVIETIKIAGGNPCPPLVVGVGIGGSFDRVAQLAKHALLREVGSKHPDPFYARMEDELLEKINDTGVGPQGLGGRTTALAVHIETAPCHIASLPVAVNTQCHSARHKTVVI